MEKRTRMRVAGEAPTMRGAEDTFLLLHSGHEGRSPSPHQPSRMDSEIWSEFPLMIALNVLPKHLRGTLPNFQSQCPQESESHQGARRSGDSGQAAGGQ